MNSGQDHEQCLLILTLENMYCWNSMHLAENEVSLTAIVTWVIEKKVHVDECITIVTRSPGTYCI